MATDGWRPTRRTALQGLLATGAGLLVGRVGYGVAYERHQIRLEQSDLRVVGLPQALDGLRIGLITDVHVSATVPDEDVRTAVRLLSEARPDLVALGGDYVTDFDTTRAVPAAELLAPLASAPLGALAVLGNHDDDRVVPAALVARGFTVLRDARTRLTIRGEPVDVAGVRYWTRRVERDRQGAAGRRARRRSCWRTTRGACARRHRSTCSWCWRATPTAARSCCRGSAPSRRAASRSWPARPPRGTARCL